MVRMFSCVPSGRDGLRAHFQPRCGWLIPGCHGGTKLDTVETLVNLSDENSE